MNQKPDIVLVHSSDLHLGSGSDNCIAPLEQVVNAARFARAQVLLLVGDVFDHNRVDASTLDAAADILHDSNLPVVVLPGNHDCLCGDSVYRRSRWTELPNVKVIGISAPSSVIVNEGELEIWGEPHWDYSDFSPLRPAPPRCTRWRVAAAHGHWATSTSDSRYAWRIDNEDVAAIDADYIALGHWEQFQCIPKSPIPACYSGSPQVARTVSAVRFSAQGAIDLARVRLTRDLTD